MTAWNLFSHAVSMLVRNRTEVVRIFLVPMILAVGIFVAALLLLGGIGAVLAGIAAVLVFFWPIVAWHRYVLSEEPVAGCLPPLRMDRIGGYILQSLLLGLLVALAMIPIMIGVSILLGVMGPGFLEVMPILQPGLALLPTWIFIRLSITLPNVALGHEGLSLSKAWKATDDFGPIFGLTAINVVVQFVIEQMALILDGLAADLWTILAGVAFALVQVSLLTTLYGVYVEKRPI